MCILTDIRAAQHEHVEGHASADKLPIASLLPGLTTIDAAHSGATPAAFAKYMNSLTAGKPVEISKGTGCYSKDLMTLRTAPTLAMDKFIGHFCHAARVEQSTLVVIAAYMRRLMLAPVSHHHDGANMSCVACECALQPVDVNPCNVHRLFAACAVIACKFVNDRVYPMSFYASQLQLKPEDLRKLEGELCRLLNFNLVVHGEEFNAASEDISAMHAIA